MRRRPEPTDTAPAFDLWRTADGAVQLQKHPDGVGPRSKVVAADGDVALPAENLRHLADDVTDAAVRHNCARCGTPLTGARGAWVSTDDTTTAGGLSFCPPDPDAARVGGQVPRKPIRRRNPRLGNPPPPDRNPLPQGDLDVLHR